MGGGKNKKKKSQQRRKIMWFEWIFFIKIFKPFRFTLRKQLWAASNHFFFSPRFYAFTTFSHLPCRFRDSSGLLRLFPPRVHPSFLLNYCFHGSYYGYSYIFYAISVSKCYFVLDALGTLVKLIFNF